MRKTEKNAGAEPSPFDKMLAVIRTTFLGSASSTAPSRIPAKRFPLQLPVSVKYGAVDFHGGARTRDVSAGGVFFYTDDDIPTGSQIELLLPVPPQLSRGAKLLMLCQAKVVRVEEAPNGQRGMGALIERYTVMHEV